MIYFKTKKKKYCQYKYKILLLLSNKELAIVWHVGRQAYIMYEMCSMKKPQSTKKQSQKHPNIDSVLQNLPFIYFLSKIGGKTKLALCPLAAFPNGR